MHKKEKKTHKIQKENKQKILLVRPIVVGPRLASLGTTRRPSWHSHTLHPPHSIRTDHISQLPSIWCEQGGPWVLSAEYGSCIAVCRQCAKQELNRQTRTHNCLSMELFMGVHMFIDSNKQPEFFFYIFVSSSSLFLLYVIHMMCICKREEKRTD